MEEGRTKQKDFAAKAYGFLVSCYYFIWPQSEFESESAFVSASSPASLAPASALALALALAMVLALSLSPGRTCNFCSVRSSELGTPATVTRGA